MIWTDTNEESQQFLRPLNTPYISLTHIPKTPQISRFHNNITTHWTQDIPEIPEPLPIFILILKPYMTRRYVRTITVILGVWVRAGRIAKIV